MTRPIDRIVIGVDFSETSEHALARAVALAAQLGASVDVVHAYGLPSFLLPMDGAVMAGASQTAELAVRLGEQLEALVARHRTEGVAIHGHLRVGNPDDELLAFAAASGAGLLVVGTHGRTGASRLIMGSVAGRVMRKSPLPVLTVGRSG